MPLNDAFALGAWEKTLAPVHQRDTAFCTVWLAELDRPLAPQLVADALRWVRTVFPIYFARLRKRRANVVAMPEPDRPIHHFICHRARFNGGPRAYMRVLANAPLDPFLDGLLRCHLVDGPTPLVALQFSHVAGDAFSHAVFRVRFADVLGALAEGHAPQLDEQPASHDVALDDVQATEDITRRAGRLRDVHMSAEWTGEGTSCEVRVFQAAIERIEFAAIVTRARYLGVTPVALIGAAFGAAVRQSVDAWAEGPEDYLALWIPRDMREERGLDGHLGNLSPPRGVPLFANDPGETGRLAQIINERINRSTAIAGQFLESISERRLQLDGNRLLLEPFAAVGVAEVPSRIEVEWLAGAHVVRTRFQTPMLTRRFAGSHSHLSCAMRWHPAFAARLQALFADFMNRLCAGSAVEWEIL